MLFTPEFSYGSSWLDFNCTFLSGIFLKCCFLVLLCVEALNIILSLICGGTFYHQFFYCIIIIFPLVDFNMSAKKHFKTCKYRVSPLPHQFQIYWFSINHFLMCWLQNDNFPTWSLSPHLLLSTRAFTHSRIPVWSSRFLFDPVGCIPPLLFWCSDCPSFGWCKPLQPASQGFVSWSHHSLSIFLFFGITSYIMLIFVSSSPRICHFSSVFPFLIVGNVNKNSDLSC